MARRNFNEEEKKIIDFWNEHKIFEKSVAQDAPHGDYIFYDGPPFATGMPHYGHIIGSVLKDVVPRYKTMRGFRVERKWGWDCHGLPIENLIEKQLDLKSKHDIDELGVDKFNNACRAQVMTYANDWKVVIERLGRFVDMENDYKTMDAPFMESIWWVFKQLWDKGLVYHDYRAMHICPRCETTLSHSEVSQGYEDIKDLSVTAKFELIDEPGTFVLAWTTTPWTLPGNIALAMGPAIEYVRVSYDGAQYILAKELVEKVFEKKEGAYEIVAAVNHQDLAGKKYKPLFSYYENAGLENQENAFTIIIEDFVTAEDGTGIVHIAPGFGEDDFNAGKRHKLPFVQHVHLDGRYTDAVTDWAGQQVKPRGDHMAMDIEIVKYLAGAETLFSKEKYEHSYPHCWRCDSPLLNYSTGSWFVAVSKIKDRMLELAEQINWVPGHIKEGRFGKWLEGARDWAISRQRYWGSVIPIWECDAPDCDERVVIGSVAELKEYSGVEVTDLHKDIVDEITWPSSSGKGTMRRIPDVLDCWFESGSMPYAQMHYPFENSEKFEQSFPAGYIAEGIDQTRAWFYYLHVLSTAITDKPAFKNVVVNGMVLAEDGKKMSKRLQNYPDPMDVMTKYGSDAMRLYLMTSPAVQAGDLRFAEKGVDEVFKKVMMIWWNVYTFYDMYADEALLNTTVERTHALDIWMHARLNQFIEAVTTHMESYEIMKASRLYAEFINDVSTWYVRRSRDRFKSNDQTDKAAALQMLREVLMKGSQVMAPFIPFITEDIFLRLRAEDDAQSIHLSEWPAAENYDAAVLEHMQRVRQVVELVLSIRATEKLKVRQALSAVQVQGIELDEYSQAILADELNVKRVEAVAAVEDAAPWVSNDGFHMKVALNTEITDELRKEGYARELIRHINLHRKQSGLTIDDHVVATFVVADEVIRQAIEAHQAEIVQQTKLTGISFVDSLDEAHEMTIDTMLLLLKLAK
jgi:isoleucyl-tRNA synthetase